MYVLNFIYTYTAPVSFAAMVVWRFAVPQWCNVAAHSVAMMEGAATHNAVMMATWRLKAPQWWRAWRFVTRCCRSFESLGMQKHYFILFLFDFDRFKSEREREKERERKKKKTWKPHLLQDTSEPHLMSLFLAPSFSALLVGRGVTTQAPSSSSNIKINKRNSRIQSQKKFVAFHMKQQKVVFLELN